MKFFPIIFSVMTVFSAFATDCPNSDEKLFLLNDKKIGFDHYNKTLFTHALNFCDYDFNCENLFINGDWKVVNDKSDDFNISGISGCFDSGRYQTDLTNKAKGLNCWCKTNTIDNYSVVSKWWFAKTFDVSQKDNKKTNDIKSDLKECMKKCSEFCVNDKYKLVSGVTGFYMCDKAVYKVKNVNCVLHRDFLHAEEIKVFNDVAQIVTKSDTIILTKDENSDWYIGTYRASSFYLKVSDNKVFVGDKQNNTEECL